MENNTFSTDTRKILIQANQGNPKLDLFLSFVWNYSLEGEVWKEIEGFDGRYYISSKGRVLSICMDRYKVLKPFICGDGYYYVDLRKDNQDYKSRVHRLVAATFLPNPENKTIVHHKDFNRLNNTVQNLIYVSHQEHITIHNKARNQCETIL